MIGIIRILQNLFSTWEYGELVMQNGSVERYMLARRHRELEAIQFQPELVGAGWMLAKQPLAAGWKFRPNDAVLVKEAKFKSGVCIPSKFSSDKGSSDLLKASTDLCLKLRDVHNDPRYQSVWAIHLSHAGQYQGPSYHQELKALELVLGISQMKTPTNCPLVQEMRGILERAKMRGDCQEAISLIEQAIAAQERGPSGRHSGNATADWDESHENSRGDCG